MGDISRRVYGAHSDRVASQVISANATLDAGDCGTRIFVDTTGVVLTLPATVVGYNYTIVACGQDGSISIAISPNAADKIQGIGLTAADNKDLILTAANMKNGDEVTLLGDGADGWFVTHAIGTWVRE
jgi:hypothetical protein